MMNAADGGNKRAIGDTLIRRIFDSRTRYPGRHPSNVHARVPRISSRILRVGGAAIREDPRIVRGGAVGSVPRRTRETYEYSARASHSADIRT